MKTGIDITPDLQSLNLIDMDMLGLFEGRNQIAAGSMQVMHTHPALSCGGQW